MTDFADVQDPALYEFALAASAIGLWSWDMAADAFSFDERSLEVTGHWPAPPTADEFRQALVDEDRPLWAARWGDAADPDRGQEFHCEVRLVRPQDGDIRWISMAGRSLVQGGEASRIVGVLRDVTDRRRSAAAIAETASRLAAIVSIAADAIISIDERQVITLFNDGAEAIFGYRREEVLGRPLDILLPERHRPAHGEAVRRFGVATASARRMGERSEIFGRRKSGEIFFAEASISKIDSCGARTYTAVLRDVTEQRTAARQLEDGKQVLEIALEVGQIGIFEQDLVTGSVFWSPIFRRMLGLDPSAPANARSLLDLTAEEDRAALAAAVAHAHDPAGNGDCAIEHRIKRPDGAMRWLAFRSHTTFVDGRPARTIGAVLDITERRRSQLDLEIRVEASTQELRREMQRREESQAQLVRTQRMEAFGQLTGGVAHDFNNLLTVITGNLELLEMRLVDEKQRLLLRRAQDAAEMGARLTGRLLTFARRRQFETSVLNLNDQVIGMAELLERTLGAPITLTTSLESSPWRVLADPSEIENAILNLAINARDAMPQGGKLIIETANVELTDSRADSGINLAPGHYVRLSVSDTGTGMPPDVLRRAFEPFFTTKDHGKGTGLGLSTIYGFVQQAKGTVTAYSEVGKGTTVNLYLPRASSDDVVQSRLGPAGDAVPLSHGEHILLVEDNPDVRVVVRGQLEALGYIVSEVDSGPAAVATIEGGAVFDLVLSDVVMAGGMSGFDVVRWAKINAPHLKIILASGYPDEVLKSELSDWRSMTLLRKPFSRTELARAVRRVIDQA